MYLEKATQPTMYFIGVTTGSSSIMKVFPEWAKALGLENAVMKGIDIAIHEKPEVYREVVQFLKDEGLLSATVSFELRREQIRDLQKHIARYSARVLKKHLRSTELIHFLCRRKNYLHGILFEWKSKEGGPQTSSNVWGAPSFPLRTVFSCMLALKRKLSRARSEIAYDSRD